MARALDTDASKLGRPPIHSSRPEYRAAHAFKDAFEPKKDADYKWVVEYSSQIYARLDQVDQTLDGKAESIITVAGGGTGLLTLGAITYLSSLNGPTTTCLMIASFLALIAIYFAVWARIPRESYLPPSVGWALAYVESYGKDAENKFLAQWHLACEGMRIAVRAKARVVTIAWFFAVAALTAIALSFPVAVATMPVKEGSTKMESTQNRLTNPPPAPRPSGAGPMPVILEGQPVAINPPLVPSPSGAPQTPPLQTSQPAVQAGPQTLQKSMPSEPAKAAEPQSIRFSNDD